MWSNSRSLWFCLPSTVDGKALYHYQPVTLTPEFTRLNSTAPESKTRQRVALTHGCNLLRTAKQWSWCASAHFRTKQDRRCTCNVSEAPSRKHCNSRKAISITYSECVPVTLVISHRKRMRRIILPSAICPAPQYFSTLPCKRHDFLKENLLTTKCVLIFSTILSEIFLIIRRVQKGTVVTVHRSSRKVKQGKESRYRPGMAQRVPGS